MRKKNLNIFYHLFFFLLLTSFVSCEYNSAKKQTESDIVSIENRYFTLDLINNSHKMSDIENHFFTTFPHNDPTEGDVVYDRKKWINKDMIKMVDGEGLFLYLRHRNDDVMFDSFRLTTKAFFNLNKDNQRILFVFKGKLPSSKGIWPAWWLNGSKEDAWTYKSSGTVTTDSDLDSLSGKGHFYDTPSAVNGPDWPGSGEIDIIETINGEKTIHNTIHTCPQMCDSEWNGDGKIINCANAKASDPNAGCSGKPYTVESHEGTFACLWEKTTIKFYYWTDDLDVRSEGGPLSEKPDPSSWTGNELKNEVRLLETESECDSELHQEWQCKSCAESNSCTFTNMKMIFNATLCGKWAGNKFDDSENALQNCRSFILGEGKDAIDGQFLKVEYVSVSRL